jgi:8-oxo-dGTP diphosphatase
MPRLEVVGAIVLNSEKQILLAQRPPGKHLAGLWEFPGGKVENGESAQAAIHRELKEELSLTVKVLHELGVYPYDYDRVSIRLRVFIVQALDEPRTSVDVQVFQWIKAERIRSEILTPADRQPLQDFLRIDR